MNSELLQLDAHGKINLYLDVTGKRRDGYHYIYSRMQDIGLSDRVIVKSGGSGRKNLNNRCIIKGVELEFCMKESTIPCDMTNLAVKGAVKALERMDLKYPGLCKKSIEEPITIEITKNIPISAGLAGGSADAACSMLAINELAGSPLNLRELMDAGIEVGSDVPFSIMMNAARNEDLIKIIGKRSVAGIVTGTGELVEPVSPIRRKVILMNPGVSVSTKEIYDEVDRRFSPDYNGEKDLYDGQIFYNILQECTLDLYEEARNLKGWMDDNLHADMILMSGSGPTMAAYYEDAFSMDQDIAIAKAEALNHEGYKVYITESGG